MFGYAASYFEDSAWQLRQDGLVAYVCDDEESTKSRPNTSVNDKYGETVKDLVGTTKVDVG